MPVNFKYPVTEYLQRFAQLLEIVKDLHYHGPDGGPLLAISGTGERIQIDHVAMLAFAPLHAWKIDEYPDSADWCRYHAHTTINDVQLVTVLSEDEMAEVLATNAALSLQIISRLTLVIPELPPSE